MGTNGWSLRKTQRCEQTSVWGVDAQLQGGILAVSKHFVKKAKDDHRSRQEPGGVCRRSGTLVGAGEKGKGPSGA